MTNLPLESVSYLAASLSFQFRFSYAPRTRMVRGRRLRRCDIIVKSGQKHQVYPSRHRRMKAFSVHLFELIRFSPGSRHIILAGDCLFSVTLGLDERLFLHSDVSFIHFSLLHICSIFAWRLFAKDMSIPMQNLLPDGCHCRKHRVTGFV